MNNKMRPWSSFLGWVAAFIHPKVCIEYTQYTGARTMDFSKVTSAIADVESQEKQFENAASSNDTAQSALVSAQATALIAAGALDLSKTDLTSKLEGLKGAIAAFEAELSPVPAGKV